MKFNKHILVGNTNIGKGSPCFIIAEAGVNHNGDLDRAKEMIDVAVNCGVDAIKFQSFITKELILSNVGMAAYQKVNLEKDGSQFEMLKQLEMPAEKMLELKEYADSRNISFLTTPFDQISLDALDICDLDAYKVASTDTTNLMFLKKIAKKGKPMLLSTGMTYMSEIRYVLEELSKINKDIILLHCTSNYPTPPQEVNLEVLRSFNNEFDIITGFSDHTDGIGASPYSLMYGVKVIEKHFTLDKNLPGPDHVASLDPNELITLVNEIRKAEKFIGSPIKFPTISELGTRASLQKSIVAARDIQKGEILTLEHVNTKRTGGEGIPALYVDQIVGRITKRSFQLDEVIEL